MTNLNASPHVFTGWTNVNVTVTPDVLADPSGLALADSLLFGATAPASRTLAIAGAPLTAQFSVWLTCAAGTTQQVQIDLIAVDGTVSFEVFTVDEFWARYELRAYDLSGIASVMISRVGTGDPYTVYAWGAFFGAVDDVFECRLDTIKQAHTLALYRVVGDRAGFVTGFSPSFGVITCDGFAVAF